MVSRRSSPSSTFVPLRIDDFPLTVHHIVKLQHIFPDVEVLSFHLLLGAFNGVLVSILFSMGMSSSNLKHIHHPLHPLAAEQPQNVVLQGQEEPAGAGVALTSGTFRGAGYQSGEIHGVPCLQ